MINYPQDDAIRSQRDLHGLTNAVIVRDVVRVVEVLNLASKNFFHKRSVLAGSMGLRCFGSPRFTVFDADFSTARVEDEEPTSVKREFAYEDEFLTITPEGAETDARESLVTVMPITFDPVFTRLAIAEDQRQFKADVSFRGMEVDGIELDLGTPYDLDLWLPDSDRTIYVMAPVETLAEKILGWVAHSEAKHYADAAWATYQWDLGAEHFEFSAAELKRLLDAKLTTMRKLQPDVYERFPNVDTVVRKLGEPPQLAGGWNKLQYLKEHRETWTEPEVTRIINELLVPKLRRVRL